MNIIKSSTRTHDDRNVLQCRLWEINIKELPRIQHFMNDKHGRGT